QRVGAAGEGAVLAPVPDVADAVRPGLHAVAAIAALGQPREQVAGTPRPGGDLQPAIAGVLVALPLHLGDHRRVHALDQLATVDEVAGAETGIQHRPDVALPPDPASG